ncbi:uncharacterized protein BCR38DRAFT_485007 [Pseudomassariella vexata]|uniref:MARVEL domain-containing protein n=1 Tax=Pseudomassariella vexata TaxID=1141098 RepID=A0A1Y2DX40_9PEZI|nr:uncharacterized protein BCR38DRAFT_485007 [Pseudomassariella vexata]ORY63860.1 hypothetical protein BCR38DRAFT_485007 [Pseudomassariella vexata]
MLFIFDVGARVAQFLFSVIGFSISTVLIHGQKAGDPPPVTRGVGIADCFAILVALSGIMILIASHSSLHVRGTQVVLDFVIAATLFGLGVMMALMGRDCGSEPVALLSRNPLINKGCQSEMPPGVEYFWCGVLYHIANETTYDAEVIEGWLRKGCPLAYVDGVFQFLSATASLALAGMGVVKLLPVDPRTVEEK